MTESALAERGRRGLVRRLEPELWGMLQAACSETRHLGARELLSEAGDDLDTSALLLDGLMARYVRGASGGETQRAIVSISVPGDFVDLHGLPLKRLDHDIGALTDVRVALFPHAALNRIIDRSARYARQLWRLTMIDAAIHRHWIFRESRLRALAAVADFVSEMDLRLREAGEVEGDRIPLPLLQSDLAEIAGLSTVHVSRVCRDLREGGTCTIRDGHAEIHDRARLHRLAHFDPSYLYTPDD
ncbi:helix-turn-helix domain-containing protein [Algicella marina]|uniref:Helix-turn-helix domain-containing protein n=2 Tax=Algicella marina TaxID=2683284 RepID=A0A6P1T5L8_9RHOB|nr:helix-turn-helix domain-containing protein [Algicella marina]